MEIAMTPAEQVLLASFLGCTRGYLEFGAGGSTCLAAALVRDSVVAVDSSVEWLQRVGAHCALTGLPLTPRLLHADIGPLLDWGFPADDTARDRWPDYHGAIWALPEARAAEFCLVDGRFRVACFLQTVKHGAPGSRIAIHDFAPRPQYHCVREFADEVARCETLSVFTARAGIDPTALDAALALHARTPH